MASTQELLVAFIAESAEALAGLDDRMLAIERGDPAAVDEIFRPVHSLKGNAAFFGLNALKELAHELESVLDRLRSGRQSATKQVVDACLAALDGLRSILASLMAGGPEIPDAAARTELLGRLRALGAGWPRALDLARTLRVHGHEADELLTILLTLSAGQGGQASSSTSTMQAMPDPSRELSDLIIVARATPSGDTAERISAALASLGTSAADGESQAAWNELVAAYQGIVDAIGFDAVAIDVLADYLPKTMARGRWGKPVTVAVVVEPEPSAASSPEPATEPSSDRRERQTGSESLRKSLRVPEADIDGFLARVGDLMVAGDGLGHIARRVSAGATTEQILPVLRRASHDVGQIADHLQMAVMRLRRVELAPQLRKAVRIARDIAIARSKEIAVTVDDGGLSIDKALVGIIDAALLHLVRNCADHGIESVAERQRVGKPRQGRIEVIATSVGHDLCLRIADDGRGIDPDVVRAKAERLGLVAAGQPLGERQLVELVFAPGVSTAERVTEISGRGVGLDAVKRSVEDSGGSIRIDNKPGLGCAFELRLPVSVATQIIPAYMFQQDGRNFGLPMAVVGETFRCPSADIRGIPGQGGATMHHGKVLSVVESATLLAPGSAVPDGDRLLVIINAGNGPYALAIDAVLGVQQVVVRPVESDMTMPPWIAGAALMGDGTVAMMIEPAHLTDQP